MEIGLVGLGKMGGNMRERLRRAGHTVTGYDMNAEVRDVDSLEAMVQALPSPRVVWVMVPSGEPTHATIRDLAELLSEGDIVIDGGNSRWSDDELHAELLAERGIGFLDCGVSGGVWGLENGYALMCGYCALMLEGVFLLALPDVPFGYDIIVHTFFLGFVFSMIFAHGPIILPGVLGLAVRPYHPFLYVPLVLLVSSVLLRIISDLNVLPYQVRTTSAWMTAAAMVFYFVTLLSLLIHARYKRTL